MPYVGAIFWAQWRTFRNFYPRRGAAWTAIAGVIWYGIWCVAALALLRTFRDAESLPIIRQALPGGFLLMFLYWQVVPLILAATGASLDLKRLRSYPIPRQHLFGIEILLRVTSAVEMAILLAGVTVGAMLNPRLAKWTAFAALLYLPFNLIIAVGLRDLLARLLARRHIRELVFFILVLGAALPQVVLARKGMVSPQLRLLLAHDSWPGWPWNAAANLVLGAQTFPSLAILLSWILAAYVFSSWQFARTLHFDADAAAASDGSLRPSGGLEWFYRLPSALWRDPLGALVEKEVRFLTRSARFRLVFLMGFTFGLLIWLPMVFVPKGPLGNFFVQNYLNVVSVYSLMLMSEVCFWNVFGFDRAGAQFYFLAPVSFKRALVAKNLAAVFFIVVEISVVTAVCALLRMPLDFRSICEAYAVTAVLIGFLFTAGNQLSIHQARGINPAHSLRTSAAGRLQATLFVVYPVVFAPIALAYLARYAFGGQGVLYGMLFVDAVMAWIFYRISLDSAAQTAERGKEQMLAALSTGDGPISD